MSVVVESVAKKDGKSPDVKVSTYTKTLSSPRPSELSAGGSQKTQSREVYLEERARHLEMPTAEEAELTPKYLYDDPVFIMHMCTSCRSINRTLPAVPVDEEYQKIELQLCRICRATYNCQRRIKFFKHDLLCVKRKCDNRLAN